MNSKTRKRIWPVSLVMALALIGVMALVVLATNTGEAQAQGLCDTASGATLEALIEAGVCQDTTTDDMEEDDAGLCDTATGATLDALIASGVCPDVMMAMDEVKSSSTSGSAAVELKLTIEKLAMDVAVGGSIVLYLEDDFAEPDSISAGDAYFVVSKPVHVTTGNGGRVYTTVDPVISTSDYFTPDKKDIAIQIFVPDLCPNATDNCEGDDGLNMNDTVSVVVTKGAGIKNPSEEGTHSTGYNVLPATHTGSVPSTPINTDILPTLRKITLFDVDNKRGFEQTVTGSGFKDGTTADVYVLHIMGTEPGNAKRNEYLWNALDCGEMNDAVGPEAVAVEGADYCGMYAELGTTEKAVVGDLDFSKGAAEEQLCNAIIREGTNVGGAPGRQRRQGRCNLRGHGPHLRPRPDQPHLHGRRHGQRFYYRR